MKYIKKTLHVTHKTLGYDDSHMDRDFVNLINLYILH